MDLAHEAGSGSVVGGSEAGGSKASGFVVGSVVGGSVVGVSVMGGFASGGESEGGLLLLVSVVYMSLSLEKSSASESEPLLLSE